MPRPMLSSFYDVVSPAKTISFQRQSAFGQLIRSSNMKNRKYDMFNVSQGFDIFHCKNNNDMNDSQFETANERKNTFQTILNTEIKKRKSNSSQFMTISHNFFLEQSNIKTFQKKKYLT